MFNCRLFVKVVWRTAANVRLLSYTTGISCLCSSLYIFQNLRVCLLTARNGQFLIHVTIVQL